MKIMVDTNIIVSSILFQKSVVAGVFDHIINNHFLTLSQYTLDELEDVFNEKFPHKIEEMKEFMRKVPYELFIFNEIGNRKYPEIRDIDDLPVLASAIESNIDILITGDKDFDDIVIEKPQIMKPGKYIAEYMK